MDQLVEWNTKYVTLLKRGRLFIFIINILTSLEKSGKIDTRHVKLESCNILLLRKCIFKRYEIQPDLNYEINRQARLDAKNELKTETEQNLVEMKGNIILVSEPKKKIVEAVFECLYCDNKVGYFIRLRFNLFFL